MGRGEKTYGLGGENVFLEEGEPRREPLDDCRAVARGHEVHRGLHGRARGGDVQERVDVDQRGTLYVHCTCICAGC